jgi:hypothetical protein
MPSGAQRFTRQQIDKALTPPPPADLPVATVTAVTAGGGTDGQALATVNYLGSAQQLAHLLTYTPAVNDQVLLARAGGTWIILGRLGGFPPPS